MHHLNYRFTNNSHFGGEVLMTFRNIGNYETGSIINIGYDVNSGTAPTFVGWFDDVAGTITSSITISGSSVKENAVAIFNSDVVLYCCLAP